MGLKTTPRGIILLLSLLAFCGGSTALIANLSRQSFQYPAATRLSEHHISDMWPNPTYKQSYSYLTSDKFPDVFNWYSQCYDLGGERQAQGMCSHLYNARPVFLLTQTTSLTLCDTPQGRMIFVQQTASLHWSWSAWSATSP